MERIEVPATAYWQSEDGKRFIYQEDCGVEGDDINIDLVAHSNHLSRGLDAVPAQLGNMDHAVHTADIHESAAERRFPHFI